MRVENEIRIWAKKPRVFSSLLTLDDSTTTPHCDPSTSGPTSSQALFQQGAELGVHWRTGSCFFQVTYSQKSARSSDNLSCQKMSPESYSIFNSWRGKSWGFFDRLFFHAHHSDKNHIKLLIQFRVGSVNYNARLLLECKFQSHGLNYNARLLLECKFQSHGFYDK